MSSSQPILSSFNPHAVHPFTAGASQSPPAARTPQHSSSATSSAQSTQTSSNSTPGTPLPVLSPQPRTASTPFKPIFTPFTLERSSPELRDILVKKKLASSWSLKPVGAASGADAAAASSVAKK